MRPGQVDASTIFRGNTAYGDLLGPIVSQFLWQDIPYGAQLISQVSLYDLPGVDYLTDFPSWLAAQNGASIGYEVYAPGPGNTALGAGRRYISTMRDFATWVHMDALYQGYLNACLILLGLGAPPNPGNPYLTSTTQIGFGTFGAPHILSLVCEAATRALKAVWYQKWNVSPPHPARMLRLPGAFDDDGPEGLPDPPGRAERRRAAPRL